MCTYIKICIIYWNEYSFSYMHPRYLRVFIIPATMCRINCHTQNSCNQWLMTIAMFYEKKWFVYLTQLCLPNCYLTHDHDKCIVTSHINCLLYTSKQLPGTTPLVNEFHIYMPEVQLLFADHILTKFVHMLCNDWLCIACTI